MKIRDDALTQERRSLNNVKHLLVVVLEQSQLETVFRRIEGNGPGTSRTIQAVCRLSFDTGEVYRVVQGADDTGVPVRQRISRRSKNECTWTDPCGRQYLIWLSVE